MHQAGYSAVWGIGLLKCLILNELSKYNIFLL